MMNFRLNYVCFAILSILIIGCKKTEDSITYPSTFTLSHFEFTDWSYNIVQSQGYSSFLPDSIFLEYESIVQDSSYIFLLGAEFKTIELLSQDSTRITFNGVGGNNDVITYPSTTLNNLVTIELGSDPEQRIQFKYDPTSDRISQCNSFHRFSKGTLSLGPLATRQCFYDLENSEWLNIIKDYFNLQPGDTLINGYSDLVFN